MEALLGQLLAVGVVLALVLMAQWQAPSGGWFFLYGALGVVVVQVLLLVWSLLVR